MAILTAPPREQAAPADEMTRRRRWRWTEIIDWTLLAAAFLVLAAGQRHGIYAPDGHHRLASLDALLRHGTLTNNEYPLFTGPVFAAPLWLAARVIDVAPEVLLRQYNMVLFVLGLSTAYLL